MLFCKLLGGVLLLGAGLGLGLRARHAARRELRRTEGFLALLGHIRTQIESFSMPIDKILACCDRRLLADCGADGMGFSDFSALLLEASGELPREAVRLLECFGKELGRGYRADQLRHCEQYMTLLERECRLLREALPRREKTLLVLPIAISAMALLMLI